MYRPFKNSVVEFVDFPFLFESFSFFQKRRHPNYAHSQTQALINPKPSPDVPQTPKSTPRAPKPQTLAKPDPKSREPKKPASQAETLKPGISSSPCQVRADGPCECRVGDEDPVPRQLRGLYSLVADFGLRVSVFFLCVLGLVGFGSLGFGTHGY